MSGSQEVVITVEKRSEAGKSAVRKLRREGRIPSVLYGGDKAPVAISVDEESVKELLKLESGGNTIFLLKLKGGSEERRAMIREIQADPISGRFIHIDFIRITRGQKVTVSMPVELFGDSVGVRHGGRIDFVSRELAVEVLPREMFDKLTYDITDMEVGDTLRVADLLDQLPPSARFLDDEERVVANMSIPRAVIEEVEEEEEVEGEELVISETAEPEVIKKGKADEEDESE
jgi:large subunit ribosomal protein L25